MKNTFGKSFCYNEEANGLLILSVARDYFHPVVKAALIREGWDVTDDPLELKVGGIDMRVLFLAVPVVAFNTFFQLDFPKMMVEENQVNLLVYDPLSQSELLWIPKTILK